MLEEQGKEILSVSASPLLPITHGHFLRSLFLLSPLSDPLSPTKIEA